MSRHDSDSWAGGRHNVKDEAGRQTPPHQKMTGQPNDQSDIDAQLKKFGDDMYFLNLNKYQMDPTDSKGKGYGYRYNLNTPSM